jgi:dipeptidyl aminopeptidase/acylaminoacyl peptidase
MMPNRSRTFVTFVASLLACSLTATAQAQSHRRLTFVDLLNVPRLSGPQLSPDGRQLIYELAEADWKADKRVSHVWRIDADGTNLVRMTGGLGEQGARWSPDGRSIAFFAKRANDEEAQVYVISNGGGEARALTHHPTSVSRLSWSPDGKTIYFVAPEPKSDEAKAREKAKDDVFAFDENYQQTHLWSVAVDSMTETRITGGDYSVLEYQPSNDGRKIACQRAPNPLFGYADQGEVWVMDADGSHGVQLTKNDVPENGATLSPDNSQVIFLAQANGRFEKYFNRKLFLVPAAGGQARVISPGDATYEVERALWSKDGKSIYFLANMGVHAELFVMPATGGTARQLTDGQHAVGADWSMAGDHHVFALEEPTNPGDVWHLPAGASSPARITHVYDYLARDFEIARQEKLQWKGADGVTVEGLLFYPLGYQQGQRYPLAVQTHGGPQTSDKFGFGSWEYYPQVLAAKGYAVLQPNYRGSTGYGDPFLRDMVGHYFQNAHLDVMAGVDDVIRRGIADPDRMVKMGWSGGGHMTNKIITFTDRFKAAGSGAGAANWVSMYAQSDIRTFRTPWFGGTPWQANAPIDLYWANSPLKDVEKVKTPTIFFVGQQDPRVPMPQSVEMYRALKSNGVPTHLYVAPREPHVWQELHHELFKMNVELEWFEKYATHRPYTWEKAPGEKADAKTTTNQ